MNILLVEDERPLGQAVIRLLTASGYKVDWHRNGTDALTHADWLDYDLIILDLLLPGTSGWDICRELRNRQVNTPILILSAMDEPGDVVRGLDAGADDYLAKPFEPGELLARVRARLRTGKSHLGSHIQVGDLEVDRIEKTATRAGQPIALTHSEFAVLDRLAAEAGTVVHAHLLAREVGLAPDPLEDPVKHCMANLMQKIDAPFKERLIHSLDDGYYIESYAIRPLLEDDEGLARGELI